MEPIISSENLPVPRIELRWNDEGTYDYDLVIPLGKLDIRSEDEDGIRSEDEDGVVGVKKELRININQTLSSPGGSHIRDGYIMPPFRDSAHAIWDAVSLGNPPIYVVQGNKAQLLS